MGGIGSGRRNQNGRNLTSDQRALDIRWLKRRGLLKPGLSFDLSWTRCGRTLAAIGVLVGTGKLMLSYRHQPFGGEWQEREYPVYLTDTACNFGGGRAWFTCPAPGCARRIGVLWLSGSGVFACRHCCRLGYASQREAAGDRAARRADRIRERLGWPPGILNWNGSKPKGMHWETYWRLRAQHDALVTVSLRDMAERLGLRNEL
jgi:hypothetical protein